MGTRDCNKISAMASPSAGEAGETGHWRTQRPEIDHAKCTAAKTDGAGCFRCWLYCPEGVVTRTVPIEIDMTYCKGCGICAEECPTGAIVMKREAADEGVEVEEAAEE